jgi:hypothetical protein
MPIVGVVGPAYTVTLGSGTLPVHAKGMGPMRMNAYSEAVSRSKYLSTSSRALVKLLRRVDVSAVGSIDLRPATLYLEPIDSRRNNVALLAPLLRFVGPRPVSRFIRARH